MLKNLILWRYGRATWQYDVMCVLILAFIFLTPKSMFADGELRGDAAHRNSVNTVTLLVPPGSPVDNPELERRVRALPGRGATRLREARPLTDAAGRVVAYELEIE